MKNPAYIFLAAAALLAVSCQSEVQPGNDGFVTEGSLCFVPTLSGSTDSVETKAPGLEATDGSMSIPLTCVVSDGISEQMLDEDSVPETKGTQINTSGSWNELGDYDIDNFHVAAWKGASNFVPAYTEVTEGSDVWTTAAQYSWSPTESATFYAYANIELPSDIASISATSSAQELTCTVPANSADQLDILMGFYEGKAKYNETLHRGGIAEMKFYHPFTAVRFKLGTFVGVTEVKIKSISIKGVYSGGTAQMTPTTMKKEDSGDLFDWDTSSSTKQTVSMNPLTGETYLSVDANNGLIGDSFIIIPQTMTTANPVKIIVTADLDGTEKRFEAKLSSGSWKAGKTNTYRISNFGGDNYFFLITNEGTSKDVTVMDNVDTGNNKEITVNITSKKLSGGSLSDWDWTVSTVKVEGGSEVPYSVGDKVCGLEFANVSGNLQINASARASISPDTHSYWINQGGSSMPGWVPTPRSGVTDLSTFNFMTEGSHAMNTANCYIIRHAGTYKLPLVYGNGIVNGMENVQAYAPTFTSGDIATNFLTPFVNHKGNGITSAFIENNPGCTAKSAGIIWQDMDIVVKNLSIVDGYSSHTDGDAYTVSDVRYLQFDVDPDKICQNNALIAIYDGPDCTGNVIWSWHIWTTNDPALLQGAIPVTNYAGNEYDFFPISNLGLIETQTYFPAEKDVTVKLVQNTTGKAIYVTVSQPAASRAQKGTFYQWGRKDPMCTKDDPVQGSFNKPDVGGSGGVSIADAICAPNSFYHKNTDGVAFNWCNTVYYNLWTGKMNPKSSKEQSADMIKTIYDPSPVGYKIPASKAFTGFTVDGNTQEDFTKFNVTSKENNFTTIKGWYFYTRPNPGKDDSVPSIYFPASGYRAYQHGGHTAQGTHTGYWTAISTQPTSALGLHFKGSPSTIIPENPYSRNYGASVRPVIDTTMPSNPMQQ